MAKLVLDRLLVLQFSLQLIYFTDIPFADHHTDQFAAVIENRCRHGNQLAATRQVLQLADAFLFNTGVQRGGPVDKTLFDEIAHIPPNHFGGRPLMNPLGSRIHPDDIGTSIADKQSVRRRIDDRVQLQG